MKILASKIKLIIIFVILLNCLTIRAQNAPTVAEINSKILEKLVLKGVPNYKKLPDSVELYTFNIQLKIIKKNNMTVVKELNVSDRIANLVFKDFNFLKDINYNNLLKSRKSASIIIPIAIIIAYVNTPISKTPMIKAEPLMEKLPQLFNYDYKKPDVQPSDFIYLAPIIVLAGTKTYN
jgi:hypothetical protein